MSPLFFRLQTPANLRKLLIAACTAIMYAYRQNNEIIKLINLAVKLSKTLLYTYTTFLRYNIPYAITSLT